MHHDAAPAFTLRHAHQRFGIRAFARTFQAVKQDEYFLPRIRGGFEIHPVQINEIIIRRIPAFARITRHIKRQNHR